MEFIVANVKIKIKDFSVKTTHNNTQKILLKGKVITFKNRFIKDNEFWILKIKDMENKETPFLDVWLTPHLFQKRIRGKSNPKLHDIYNFETSLIGEKIFVTDLKAA